MCGWRLAGQAGRKRPPANLAEKNTGPDCRCFSCVLSVTDCMARMTRQVTRLVIFARFCSERVVNSTPALTVPLALSRITLHSAWKSVRGA